MKIFAFTDIHGNDKLIQEVVKQVQTKNPELVVCSGDITIFGRELNEVLEKLDKIKKRILIIPGNHEDSDELKKACKNFENITYLHRGVFQIENYAFFGYGGDGFSEKDKIFERLADIVGEKFKEKEIILVTHQPPYGNKLDNLEYFEHVGNKSYTYFIKKYKPILAISGHIHESFGKIDHVDKKTILINPGPLGRLIEI